MIDPETPDDQIRKAYRKVIFAVLTWFSAGGIFKIPCVYR